MPIPASLTAILATVKNQILLAVPQLSDNQVRIVARAETKRFRGSQDILLRPGPVSWDRGFDVGSGRMCPIIRRPLYVHIRTRLNTDPSDSDELRLTDPTYGHIPLEESICDVLLDFIPQGSAGEWFVQEPMHPLDYREEEEQQEGEARDWVETTLAFQLTYQLPLTQTGYGY